jgi:hypothetical protein
MDSPFKFDSFATTPPRRMGEGVSSRTRAICTGGDAAVTKHGISNCEESSITVNGLTIKIIANKFASAPSVLHGSAAELEIPMSHHKKLKFDDLLSEPEKNSRKREVSVAFLHTP